MTGILRPFIAFFDAQFRYRAAVDSCNAAKKKKPQPIHPHNRGNA